MVSRNVLKRLLVTGAEERGRQLLTYLIGSHIVVALS
jgi:hypothetical protein